MGKLIETSNFPDEAKHKMFEANILKFLNLPRENFL